MTPHVGRPIVAAGRLSRRLDPLESGSAGRISRPTGASIICILIAALH
jgi:hypothetical protein